MNTEGMFEQGIRAKVRFNWKGVCRIEDLYNIPIVKENGIYKSELNDMYCDLEALKKNRQGGLYDANNKEDHIVNLKMEIIKHVYTTRVAEIESKANEIKNSILKNRLIEKLNNKKDEKYDNMTEEELLKEIDKL